MHCWTGCDTTSATHAHGKKSLLKWTKDSNDAIDLASLFYKENQTPEAVENAGIQIFIHEYKGMNSKSLNDLRYCLYVKYIASSNAPLRPEVLPPTESAARQHARRVYHQVQTWLQLRETLDPTKWGWKLENGRLTPIMTEFPLAPNDLLKVVRCACRHSNCSTKLCSCRKAGIPCVSACSHCTDNACQNQ